MSSRRTGSLHDPSRLRAACALAAGLVCALAVAVPAGAATLVRASDGAIGGYVSLFSETDGDIPGVALPASPVAGTLDDTVGVDDWDDVYGVPLAYNQKLTVELTGTAGTDFDLWLWRPGSTSVFDPDPAPHIANSSQTRGTSTESMWYPASQAGTYYLDVFSDRATSPNKGAYSLSWSLEQLEAPEMQFSADRTLLAHGASVKLSGVVAFRGAPHVSNPVLVQRRYAGSKQWTALNADRSGRPVTRTDDSGAFSYTVSNVTHKADYRAIVWPTQTAGWRHGAAVTVTPRVYLSRPYAPSRVYRNRPFTVYGDLKPRHQAGQRTVTVTAYRLDSGVWRRARNSDHRGNTRYTASFVLPDKGRWKLVATTSADTEHAATTSAATYVTVR